MIARIVPAVATCLLAVSVVAASDSAFNLSIGGHIKTQFVLATYPDDSVLQEVFGEDSEDLNLDARAVLAADSGPWTLGLDLQAIAVHGDRTELAGLLPEDVQAYFPGTPSDQSRFFDLTHEVSRGQRTAVFGRVDRMVLGYTTDSVVLRAGRQAISWGNGLMYSAMDIFNSFDPTAIDKEYKTGDDMLYGQFLRSNGDDFQSVVVVRRNPLTGDVESDVGSGALKYHGLVGGGEYDALVARHFGDTLVGFGLAGDLGGAVWGGDLVVTWTDDEAVVSMVTNLSYSWTWGGTNVSGSAEYFYNGFGRADGCYSPACLAEEPDLVKRVARGEVYTLGRHYLALGAQVEVHPLFVLNPSLFVNLHDPSAILQIAGQHDLRRNWVLLGSISVPIGGAGTEFGGPSAGIPDRYLSVGPSLFLQLGWYW